VPVSGEWIGERNPEHPDEHARGVDIRCASATSTTLPPQSLDAGLH